MNDNTQSTADTVKVRLMLDVTYLLNGEVLDDLLFHLHQQCMRAIGDGLLTGGSNAQVEQYEIDVSTRPIPLSEAEIADFMRQRIEDGNLSAEDIPTRLARYGLMTPDDFVSEMRERMETTLDD
ncbi:hypothetical protein [Pseudothauera nasutitermitis]|uniref:hypothetical protein n=1 Tax=Pseudothauera nasutitermitis TaxID=2565930 RepID=UPI001E36FDE3|nr:hypothetical protein [Pseudothauera nasutitermitis]